MIGLCRKSIADPLVRHRQIVLPRSVPRVGHGQTAANGERLAVAVERFGEIALRRQYATNAVV